MTTPTDGHPIDQVPTPQPHRPRDITLTGAELDLVVEKAVALRLALLPAEGMALTVGLAQTLRGEAPEGNVAAMCVLALARLTGRHDWTAEVEVGQS